MEKDKIIPLSLDHEGQHYEGEIAPSADIGENGMPVYYRVSISGELFAYICCGNKGWWDRESMGKPKELINAIGNYIMEYYE